MDQKHGSDYNHYRQEKSSASWNGGSPVPGPSCAGRKRRRRGSLRRSAWARRTRRGAPEEGRWKRKRDRIHVPCLLQPPRQKATEINIWTEINRVTGNGLSSLWFLMIPIFSGKPPSYLHWWLSFGRVSCCHSGHSGDTRRAGGKPVIVSFTFPHIMFSLSLQVNTCLEQEWGS